MKYVNNVTTLVFYDVPQVLIGQSKDKKFYLAVLYNITDNGVLQYTATQLDEYKYRDFLFKDTDIRSIILSNDTYLATYDGESLCLQDDVIIPSENMLPEPNCTISDMREKMNLNDLRHQLFELFKKNNVYCGAIDVTQEPDFPEDDNIRVCFSGHNGKLTLPVALLNEIGIISADYNLKTLEIEQNGLESSKPLLMYLRIKK